MRLNISQMQDQDPAAFHLRQTIHGGNKKSAETFPFFHHGKRPPVLDGSASMKRLKIDPIQFHNLCSCQKNSTTCHAEGLKDRMRL